MLAELHQVQRVFEKMSCHSKRHSKFKVLQTSLKIIFRTVAMVLKGLIIKFLLLSVAMFQSVSKIPTNLKPSIKFELTCNDLMYLFIV